MVRLMIIHCHSSRSICPLPRPNRLVEWRSDRNHQPFILQVLDGGNSVCNPSRNTVLFWFTVFLGRSNSSGFLLAFSTIISLNPQFREPIQKFTRGHPLDLNCNIGSSLDRVSGPFCRFGLISIHNCVNQFLKISLSLPTPHFCFCVSGEH